MSDLERRLLKRLEREKRARQEAEYLLEQKASELFKANTHLQDVVSQQEELVRRRTEELSSALQSAKTANRHKSYFLANMSHEIRTPMNAIIGLTHLLNDTSLNHQQRDYLNKVQSSASNLLVIINDILDFSKIESGQLQLEEQRFCLDDVLRQVYDVNHLNAHKKGIELVMDYDFDVPRCVKGDSTRLGQILTNLVNNAIKFTQHGEVSVSVYLLALSKQNAHIEISVRDTGIGIDKSLQRHLFAPFMQADISTSRRYGGTGLGLSITKQLVEMMGGEISVSSEVGSGSEFRICLFLPYVTEALGSVSALNKLTSMTLFTSKPTVPRFYQSFEAPVQHDWVGGASVDRNREEIEGDIHTIDARGLPDSMVIKRLRLLTKVASQTCVIVICTAKQKAAYIELGYDKVRYVSSLRTPEALTRQIVFALAGAKDVVASSFLNQDSGVLKGMVVLVAEDNEINRMIVISLLEKLGVRVLSAMNGAEAYSVLLDQAVDLVLMDVQMPVLDGFKATQKIRSQAQFENLPIIALTAHAMVGDYERSIEAGMNDHITKPIDPSELKEVLIKWRLPDNTVPDHTQALVHLPNSLPGLDLKSALLCIPGGLTQYLELWARYKRKYPFLEFKVKELYELRQLDSLKFLGHDLKGIFSSLGAVNLLATARDIENLTLLDDSLLGALFERLHVELIELDQNLRVLSGYKSRSLAATNGASVDLIYLLKSVASYARDGDADAVSLVASLEGFSSDERYSDRIVPLVQSLKDYEFTAAFTLAEALLKEMEDP